jgi:hypothetical protein
MKTSMTREENRGLRWAHKFHPMGRVSNHQNDMVYQPPHPPDPGSLDLPLFPLHRAELREALAARGIPEPVRPLTRRDYYAVLRQPLTDAYEGTRFKEAWEAAHPELAAGLREAWEVFLSSLPPPDFQGLGWQGPDVLPPAAGEFTLADLDRIHSFGMGQKPA